MLRSLYLAYTRTLANAVHAASEEVGHTRTRRAAVNSGPAIGLFIVARQASDPTDVLGTARIKRT